MNDSKIEWTDDTINPWWGCAKVSLACTHCYAETLDARFHPAETPKDEPARALHWGPQAPRLLRVEKAIGELERSARRAVKEGRRRRVFTDSMGDIFEDRPDLVEPRRVFLGTLHDIQEQTGQALIPLLLTKRPEVALEYARANPWPLGAWLGVTVEDQQRADERIPVALEVAALTGCQVFLSMEPLLGPVGIGHLWRHCWSWPVADGTLEQAKAKGTAKLSPAALQARGARLISWVIVGGESGHGARPMHPEWARSLRDQCQQAGVPFHFKQRGCWTWDKPDGAPRWPVYVVRADGGIVGDADPGVHKAQVWNVGKKAAGRLLDGRTHDDVPR